MKLTACRLPILAVVLVTQVPSQVHAEPFALEDVDFTSACGPNPAFERLLDLIRGPGGDQAAAEFDEPLYNAVSAEAVHILRLRREADWHGLRLVEVRWVHGIESGPNNHSLVFADSPERVHEVWSARGWELPPAGQTRVIDDEAILTAVGLETDGGRTAVTCFSD